MNHVASKSQIAEIQSETKKAKTKLRSHVPKLVYCLNGHLKHIVDTAISKTKMYNYDPQRATSFSENLSLEIALNLKSRNDRFRIVVLVTIIQKNEQLAECKMGFLWDATQDHWNKYVFDCRTFQLIASVMCVYLD